MKKITKALTLLLSGLLCSACLLSCAGEDPRRNDRDDDDDEAAVQTTTGEAVDNVPDGDEVTDKLTQENVLSQVTERMRQLKSYSMGAEMKMNMTMMGMSIAANMEIDAIMDAEGKRNWTETTTEMLGENVTAVVYYDEEVYYIESDGQKMVAEMDEDVLDSMVSEETEVTNLDPSYFESFKLYSADDGYLLVISGLKEGSSLLGSAMNSAMLEGYEVDLSDIEIEMTISADYCVTEMTMTMTMSMNMDEALEDMGEMQMGDMTATVEMNITYSDFDSAAGKLVKPDMTGAEEFDLEDLLALTA
ncbi:MAG: hypothetical protein IJX76_10150 [Clostridia bacterium]|nr:hypothetical protein [Clostridia bacterium]